MLSIDSKAPNFTLPNQLDKPISLSDFLGKWVIVYFYPKDDTPGCTTEACNFRDDMDQLIEANVEILGISKDNVTSHKKFADKYNLNFNILADPERTVIESYGAWQEKSMYGKKYMGIQRMTYIIDPTGTVRHLYPKVTPNGHAKEILKQIKELS